MAKEKAVDAALAQVGTGRRGFLKGLLIGSAALAALPLLKSEALAQDTGTESGGGKKKKKKKTDTSDHRF